MSSGIEDIKYTVRRSDRARRVRVTVDPARGVEVVIPRRATLADAHAAARQYAPWIRRRLADQRLHQQALASRGDTLPYLGTTLTLHPEPGRTRAHRRGDVLLLPGGPAGPPGTAGGADPPYSRSGGALTNPVAKAAVERWYRRMARSEVQPRLERACAQLGVSYTQLTIRGQKTRWGSCSGSGAMSFNWRLLLAPEAVLDYVIWHEACHLRVMDHSPRFWALVAEHCPDYKTHAAWLRANGTQLVL